MAYATIFGPVQSSRLGLSLGLDLLGRKICNFDCLYCEVGPTRAHTLARRPYVDPGKLLGELEAWLAEDHPRPDHITLGGMGEPCLNSGLEAIITGVRRLAPGIPLAVLTNSTLFNDPDVVRALKRCDVVLPSMDTLVQEEFERLNRPCAPLLVKDMADHLLAFKREFAGRLFLEILLVKGMNDTSLNLSRLQAYCNVLLPDRIDVVTLSRPGAYSEARAVSSDTLALWREALGAGTDPVTFRRSGGEQSAAGDASSLRQAVLTSLRRRPQRPDQLAAGLGLALKTVQPVLTSLSKQGHIRAISQHGERFFAVTDDHRQIADT